MLKLYVKTFPHEICVGKPMFSSLSDGFYYSGLTAADGPVALTIPITLIRLNSLF